MFYQKNESKDVRDVDNEHLHGAKWEHNWSITAALEDFGIQSYIS